MVPGGNSSVPAGFQLPEEDGVRTNHLVHETSPYLRQHVHNFVDWYPWGPEPLEKARQEDKPIFLSIGYSSCHWCHVMAHESFEDGATAAYLNEHFVSIKVDREERPDIDALYMRSVMLLTGSGGWPLSVFLTHDAKPFFGGTYFPKEARWGMSSFRRVLEGVWTAYHERRSEVDLSADRLLCAVGDSLRAPDGTGIPGPGAADEARRAILGRYDPDRGGFGHGPKFPQPPLLQFLLDESARTGDRAHSDRVFFTLRKMEAGGVRDQVGGGFHRYSVDGEWLVPHYEKMLYDNAQLASLYFGAYSASGDEAFKTVAQEVLADVTRSMGADGGGFVAGLDADSEGEEGKFYLWNPGEMEAALGEEEGQLVAAFFGIASGPGLEGQTLHRVEAWEMAAKKAGQTPAQFRARIAGDLERLRLAREGRVHPHVDTKVLTDWNALAAKALLDGHVATGEAGFLDTGRNALSLLWKRCWKDGRLYHVWDGEEAKVPGFLSDYAYLAQAEWRAFEASGDGAHLDRVGTLLTAASDRFRQEEPGHWVDAPASCEDGGLLLPVRDADDGVLPAPLSVLACVLWGWERLNDAGGTGEALDDLLRAEGGALTQNPGAQPLLAELAALRSAPPVDVVVAAPSMGLARPLLEAARGAAPLGAVVLPLLASGMKGPAAEGYALFRGRWSESDIRAFVCVGGTCGLPVRTCTELADRLTPICRQG